MKIRIERDVLANAVAWAARTLPPRPPVPVLAGLLLEAEGQTLRLSGFDYEVSGRVDVTAEIDEPGRALVSGRLLADIARSLPSKMVDLVSGPAGGASGQKVTVTCGSSRFTLLTLPDDEYPTLPEMPTAAGTVAGDLFATAVSQVAISAGRDDTLPVLTGVRIEIEGESVTLAATDRYRLAVREFQWSPEQAGASAVALVPARTLIETARALGGGDKIIVALATGGTGEGLIGFDAGGRRTTSRLLDGEFPRYRSLLPTHSDVRATIETAPLTEAVRRVALVAERNTPIRLIFSAGVVTLEAGSGEEAQASEQVECSLDGEDITVAFNPGYLLDGLGACGTPFVHLSFTTSTKPAIMTGKAEADAEPGTDYRYLIMPVRLSG